MSSSEIYLYMKINCKTTNNHKLWYYIDSVNNFAKQMVYRKLANTSIRLV